MGDSDSDSYDPAENSNTKAVQNVVNHPYFSATVTGKDSTSSVSAPLSLPSLAHQVETETRNDPTTAPSVTADLKASLTSLGYVLHGASGRVRSVCLNPSGSILCSGAEGGSVCMWDFTIPMESRAVKPTRVLTPFPNRISGFQPVVSVHSSSDGSFFVACQDGDSPVLIAASGKQLGYCAMGQRGMVDVLQCKGHRAPVTCSAASPTVSSRFFTGSQDSTARMWDAASFDRHSVYAVKHGSGQLLENVVVEAVAPILSINNDKKSVFSTGGEDGLVQLWDSRQKYRPGGAIGALDLYSSKSGVASKSKVTNREILFEEKHVGGMVEPDTSRPILCVRCGSEVRMVDLRKMGNNGVIEDVCPPLEGLPCATDTTPLVACTGVLFSQGKPSFMTCTSRAGYRHVAGGHVVQFTYMDGRYEPTMVWRPAAPEDDVLSLAVDVKHGQLFAGMQTGNVVGRVKRLGVDSAANGSTLQTWFATRPERESRVVGKKSTRENTDGDEEEDEVVF
ncbi:hypothetical protein TraAM80_00643 [Trypanosoma rangeli]|uniref:Guanine nucleotide-binding protein subunit beta-like protein n=1 Tax=Trypanosoma rangeli TaxID=5698 RepID=A0A422P2K2_TRYRA|nr:uncharacterized protein TraAM80_00643 [Trypanosoma rangeli]RNF11948.1 hypothetical protein TraAM80_00643 [Trypanosoma rangeli]|eukprot:RNF11948.1 hypothetical protein TraAM80_00643 [Trypanosoma rangeli]